MSDSGEMDLYQELLKLLAEEQNLSEGPLDKKDVERREYRHHRIREVMLQLGFVGTQGKKSRPLENDN